MHRTNCAATASNPAPHSRDPLPIAATSATATVIDDGGVAESSLCRLSHHAEVAHRPGNAWKLLHG
ncbi:hypothetical protein M2275_004353 [Rhodococcus opacus]|nr:hypothetical protein [Rhodococcus opacus]